jgi:hypothetical protein
VEEGGEDGVGQKFVDGLAESKSQIEVFLSVELEVFLKVELVLLVGF